MEAAGAHVGHVVGVAEGIVPADLWYLAIGKLGVGRLDQGVPRPFH